MPLYISFFFFCYFLKISFFTLFLFSTSPIIISFYTYIFPSFLFQSFYLFLLSLLFATFCCSMKYRLCKQLNIVVVVSRIYIVYGVISKPITRCIHVYIYVILDAVYKRHCENLKVSFLSLSLSLSIIR